MYHDRKPLKPQNQDYLFLLRIRNLKVAKYLVLKNLSGKEVYRQLRNGFTKSVILKNLQLLFDNNDKSTTLK